MPTDSRALGKPTEATLAMLHQLMVRLAATGGECALGFLLVLNIVSVAIISNRAWFFVRRRIDADLFARELMGPLCAGDWLAARTIASQSTASICLVVAAGLSQMTRGPQAVRAAMRSTKSRERIRMDGQIGALSALGWTALLIGLVGSLLNLMRACSSPAIAITEVVSVLAPATMGLMVAIPALLASSLLKLHVQDCLRRIDCVGQLLLLQLAGHRRRSTRLKRRNKSEAA